MDTTVAAVVESTANLQLSCSTGPSVVSAAAEDGRGEWDELGEMEHHDLDAQLRVEAMCEVLEALPKRDLLELVLIIGVKIPSNESGARLTKTALVHEALAHLHEEMHRGGDLRLDEYENTIYLRVMELVDEGIIADPRAAMVPEGEEFNPMHVYKELASYLPALSELDLCQAVVQIDCICLLDAKTQPMSGEELAQEILGHLQHKINERLDFSVERDLLRHLYQYRGEDSDSDAESDCASSDSKSEGNDSMLPADLSSSRGVEPKMTLRKIKARIDRLARTLNRLPDNVYANVVSGPRARWMVHGPGEESRKEVVHKMNAALFCEASFGSQSEAMLALQDFEKVIGEHRRQYKTHFLQRTLKDRGRRWWESRLRAKRLAEEEAELYSSESSGN